MPQEVNFQQSLFGKTSWELCYQETGWILEPCCNLSQTPKFQCLLPGAGPTPEWCEAEAVTCAGVCWTPSIGQTPGWPGVSGCSSWRILEAGVPERSCLSPAACSRLLRLAETLGCPPAGGNRIPVDEARGPLPVVHPFQGYRMRGAAKAGDVGNFLGSFGKPTDPFPTLMAGGLTVFALWREGREAEGVITWLTPTEGERAMGLPDGWTAFGHDGRPISARARQKALGNSIALPCAEYIMAGIREELEGGKNDSDT